MYNIKTQWKYNYLSSNKECLAHMPAEKIQISLYIMTQSLINAFQQNTIKEIFIDHSGHVKMTYKELTIINERQTLILSIIYARIFECGYFPSYVWQVFATDKPKLYEPRTFHVHVFFLNLFSDW